MKSRELAIIAGRLLLPLLLPEPLRDLLRLGHLKTFETA